MRIVGARVEPLRLALRTPLATARGAVAVREGFLLRLASDDGGEGQGEASPAYWLGDDALADVAAALDRIVERCRLHPTVDEARAWLGAAAVPPAAACALDAALLDLEARARGVAVAALLGATDAAPVAIAALLAGRTPADAAAEAGAALAAGFRTVKMKVGAGTVADDRARVAAVCACLPADARLRLDANRAWSRTTAEAALAALAPFDPEYVEEPLAEGGAASLAALARATPVPLAIDESLRDAGDLERLVAAGARLHVVLKAARVGGPTALVALARRAVAAGLPVTVTDAIESGVGMRHAVHAAAALSETAAVGLGGAQLVPAEEALRTPVLVATGPGIAVAPRAVVAAAASSAAGAVRG